MDRRDFLKLSGSAVAAGRGAADTMSPALAQPPGAAAPAAPPNAARPLCLSAVFGCWAIVESAEQDRKHCVLMENCNYDRAEMMVYNMVRLGLFGEILHAEGGYLHDLRGIKFADEGEGLWRRAWATKLNGNLYPTHGLGPVANCLDINRGDRFDHLVSMSGPSRGLQDWAAAHVPADSPKRKEQYACGDVNVSLIQTA